MNLLFSIFLAAAIGSCKPAPQTPVEPDPDPIPVDTIPALKPKLEILQISFPDYPSASAIIDDDKSEIAVTMPYGTTLGPTTIDLVLSEGAISDPESGSTIDLSKPFNIFLSLESGSARRYRGTATTAKSNVVSFKWVEANDYLIRGERNGNNLSFTFPFGADLSNISFSVPSDYVLSFEPDITQGVNLTSPLEVKFFAEDGETFQQYTLEAHRFPKDTGVRGIYLPAPSHSSSFANYENLCKSLDLLYELNFNCLFVCAWAGTKTAWESDVLLENTTYQNKAAGNMYRNYTGGSGDAIADMISEAHKRGIKLVLWFEYGFMHGIGGVDHLDPLIAKHPTWLGIGNDGGYCNYNGNDYYLNAYDPEVQRFMLDLICEAVRRYPDLDGVQGDDRLPASPRNSGYNETTRKEYRSETGREVPDDYQDAEWVNWRRNRLNNFAVMLHDEVKAIRRDCLVCFAPNKYPWADGVLFQDWPSWVKAGAVDLLTVQCYVTVNYENDVTSQLNLMKECGKDMVFQPAMILKNGSALLPSSIISEELCFNRKAGTFGEAQFWFDGLWDPEVQKMFRLFYSDHVDFPEL